MDLADLAQPDIDASLTAALAQCRRCLYPVPQVRELDGTPLCADCGVPLLPARLAILPRACRCAECQGRREACG